MQRIFIIIISSFLFVHSVVTGQPSFSFDLKKPPKFENKKLGSEKTGNKKFTVPRRFLQNTYTHYNYYFNANNKLNEIVARAKLAQRDDYTELLPFYGYSLQGTAAFKSDLDSVIYKSTAGVLIHDLRNDWIDNLYLLIGKAYYLRNDADSAYLTFQYLNYAFSPKEKDGYDKVIGSNQNEGSNAFSISTKEHRNIIDRAFSEAPSRNESLVWQVKTYLSKNELAEASGLIETLKHDPLFPSRLNTDLEEVQALWYYKQLDYDNAAAHLEKALGNAEGNQELARWEYLVAQLYERSGKHTLAEKYYNKTIRHTINPVLEVYARLNAIRQNKNGSEKEIQGAIDALIQMTKKDRYLTYRDIIYYTAAVIEIERKNPAAAKLLLVKSVKTNANNPAQKNRSFMALGDLTFNQKQYTEAKNFYDSVEVQMVPAPAFKDFTERKDALAKIVRQTSVLERQDSLQRIAALPVAERDAFVKKLVKLFRKQQGIKEDEGGGLSNGNLSSNATPDLFGSTSAKGEWYFSNSSLKTKGLADFKAKWGNRPNADNWRRAAATPNAQLVQTLKGRGFVKASDAVAAPPLDISYEGLLSNLPLTPEKLKISRDSVENALFEVGKAYMNGLEDYPFAIDAFEKLLTGYPATLHAEEAWYNLYYCYKKTGEPGNMAKVKQMLASKFPNGKFSNMLGLKTMSQSPDSIQKNKATVQYEGIYNLFIEGNFAEAVKRKKVADSVYGKSFWTPQLLFIEAVYYIKQQKDSVARTVLGNILQTFPTTPIYNKTVTMLEVLSRRKQIEDYLTKLDLKKLEESVAKLADDRPVMTQGAVVPLKVDSAKIKEAEKLAATLKAQKEIAEAKVAKELKEKLEKEAKEAAVIKSKKEEEAKLAAVLEAKRKEAEIKAAKALQEKKDAAELAAKLLQQKKDLAEKAVLELQTQRDLAARAVKESIEKKQLDSAIAAKELEMKKQAADIAAKEILAKKEKAEIVANEKKAADLAEKERLYKEAREKKALALAVKEIADKAAKDKKTKELSDKEQAKKELSDKKAIAILTKRSADSIVKKELADTKLKNAEAKRLADSTARQDLAKNKKIKTDTARAADRPVVTSLVYSNRPAEAHYVVLVLEKVDPVYATEARNAFNRYHRENYTDKNIATASFSLTDDTKLLLINNFENASSAMSYVDKTQKLTQTEIIPWLTAQKYSFLLISTSNLEILKSTKDVTSYRDFLKELYPGKF